MIGWGRISNGEMEWGRRRREGLHEETGDRRGGNMEEGGVRDEGQRGWAW